MTGPARKQPPPPNPGQSRPAQPGGGAAVAQAMKTFSAIRTAGGQRGSAGEELVHANRDLFQIRQADRGVMVRPNGTYNFVRVAGETRNAAQTLVSAKSGHAAIAGGRPVLYAGTVRFDNGHLDWWSNYSGTYQPVAAFRQQAGLPDERFTPWQGLQMGGVGMQRGTFLDRRDVGRPSAPERGEAQGGPAPGGPARPTAAGTMAKGREPDQAKGPATPLSPTDTAGTTAATTTAAAQKKPAGRLVPAVPSPPCRTTGAR